MGFLAHFNLTLAGEKSNLLSYQILVFLLPLEVLSEILRGGMDIAKQAGIPILGGHSIKDKEPKYGMVVTGESLNGNLIKNSTAKAEDQLILTKPVIQQNSY